MGRWTFRALALAVLVFGFLCVNYTTYFGEEHHREWAEEAGMPAPNPWIYDGGVVLLVVSAGAFGFSLAKRPTTR